MAFKKIICSYWGKWKKTTFNNRINSLLNTAIAIAAIWVIVQNFDIIKSSQDSTEAAQKSVKYADSLLRETRRFNDSTILLAQKAYISDSIESIKRFKSDSILLYNQAQAIAQETLNFKIANEPYLQLSDAVIDTFTIGKQITIHFQLENLGNYPVKIINVKDFHVTRVTNPGLGDINNAQEGSLLNSYIVRGSNQIFQVSFDGILNQNRFNMVMNGTWKLWYGGKLTYQNLITNKLKTYEFMILMRPNKIGQLLVNNNNSIAP